MKTKIYKLLSILVTLAILATTCLCVFGTVSAAVCSAGHPLPVRYAGRYPQREGGQHEPGHRGHDDDGRVLRFYDRL